ncbi:MAG: GGDEF-domain containing protein [Acidovorax sp. 16-64-162]|uniref:putative bifunctional diguanylate cyclase/phosphodiesterase n=1 Tax=Acidovorax sp. 16-64-162 TaxID=1970307 RepID=UPI000BDCB3CB|nr:EAL domain-containing protein [Acidovorax sp. 16-64-162]OYZ47076.1 MAG: GGDEF-domain containing protein [Acidovorax sp. 16-64-162]
MNTQANNPQPQQAPGPSQTALSSRLAFTSLLAAGLALLTLVLALTAVNYWSTRTTMLQDSRVEAAIVADNISAAVVFRDTQTAKEMLRALRLSPMVMGAGVYDSDGVLLAHYVRQNDPGFPSTVFELGMGDATERAGLRTLEIAHPIVVPSAVGGTLYIRKSRSRTAVRDAENRLQALAHTDAVTGVGNRHAFNERLAAEMRRAVQLHGRVALVYIDLDNFKTHNDTFGHAAGDGLLRQVARRLQSVVRGTDAIARLGGDEFALILRLDMDDAALQKYGQRIINVFQAPYTEGGQEVNVTCSAGVATFPDDASDIDGLISNADTAMYRAKEMGKNRYVRFEASMNQAAARRHAIEIALRAELEHGDGLSMHYQPLISAADASLVGAEALLRWTHAELGNVSPMEAISVAEDCGLIVALGYWTMRAACRDAASWGAGKSLRVAVNISARQLGDPQFLQRVMDILREEGLPAHRLEIELTETVLMENMEAGAHTLHRLSQLGIHLAIDDFGTGYSSLAYLRQLPMQRLKIDRSFVKDLPQQENSRTIVTAIVALAHGLGLQVTAEGVETREQADHLIGQGCDILQGYVFARPMPAQQFLAFQQEHRADRWMN